MITRDELIELAIDASPIGWTDADIKDEAYRVLSVRELLIHIDAHEKCEDLNLVIEDAQPGREIDYLLYEIRSELAYIRLDKKADRYVLRKINKAEDFIDVLERFMKRERNNNANLFLNHSNFSNREDLSADDQTRNT